jgi:hypothetical protein
MYVDLTRNAIHDERDDNLASPALHSHQQYTDIWTEKGKKKMAVVIAHSMDDGWVDWKQVHAMEGVLRQAEGIGTSVLEIKGQHNDIWGKGTELARAIVEAFGVMRGLERY